MCKLLNISSSSLYYAKNKPAKKYNAEEEKLTQHIKEIFKNSRNNYGSRKIKVELKKKGIIASKRRIRRIMKENGLVSTYTVKQYKVHKQTCNNDKIDNKLKRNFNQEERMKVIVSDLTYVNVAGKWNYICLMLDLYNREIVGYTAGKHKDADLVRKAITTIKYDLNKIEIFHTDRGNEFKNNIIIMRKEDVFYDEISSKIRKGINASSSRTSNMRTFNGYRLRFMSCNNAGW